MPSCELTLVAAIEPDEQRLNRVGRVAAGRPLLARAVRCHLGNPLLVR